MDKTNKNLYATMVATAADYVSTAVKKYLPDSTQKNFMLWILADGNPYQEKYLRMMGVAGSIELEIFLFEKVINLKILQKLSHHIGLPNAYFAFETLSDNIEIGLGTNKENNSTSKLQRELVGGFNDVMIKKLQGDATPVIELLAPYEHLTKKISAYEKCLAPEQMYQFAEEYQKQFPNASLAELEYSYFPILILNIETCLDLLESLRQHPIYSILKATLIDRYASVSALINPNNRTSLETLADLGG